MAQRSILSFFGGGFFFLFFKGKRRLNVSFSFLVLGAGDETGSLVLLGGNTRDGVDLVGTSILVRGLLPLLGHGRGLLATYDFLISRTNRKGRLVSVVKQILGKQICLIAMFQDSLSAMAPLIISFA